jgi:excisionase family DNA binding protein
MAEYPMHLRDLRDLRQPVAELRKLAGEIQSPPRQPLRRESRRPPLRRDMTDTVLRTGEVAALLQISHRTVLAWAKKGWLPSIQTPGGQRRYRASDLEAVLERMVPRNERTGEVVG